MSKTFVLSRDEIVAFAKKIYEEGCGGYMDLCDSVSERMTTELLDAKRPRGGEVIWDSLTNQMAMTSNYEPVFAGNVVVDPVVRESHPVREQNFFRGT